MGMNRKIFFYLLPGLLFLASCNTIDLYEKVVPLKNFEWASSYKPEFRFSIKDTSVPYQVYIVLRHNDRYNWNNIWVNLYTEAPGDSIQKIQYELPLANKERWLGSAMDDVYEHRVLITPQPIYFKKAGDYKYKIEHSMREDPLQNVLNVGLRVEKKSR
jgi:gliding motility-associated lipoprotein GldH